MLDKVLTGENVKVNGEIAGRRHILRTLIDYSKNNVPLKRCAHTGVTIMSNID
jgi:hypothetical protein